jgi:FixJ family two-component response regulator
MITYNMMEHETDATPVPHIAVVDDDVSFLRSMGRLLRSAGYEVETFGSARQFLSTVTSSLPQCLVLDVHMPEMTGLQLQDTLEAQGYCVPIILVTAYDTPQTREHARRAGSFGLLLKPFGKEDLLQAIQMAITSCHLKVPHPGTAGFGAAFPAHVPVSQ